MSAGALAGVRVLDLSRILAGPWCGQILADLGADVIKVERPGRGDDTRAWGPPYLRDGVGAETSEAGYYLAANRGKRSVTVDIASPDGQQVVRDLAAVSDVLLENYKVGGLVKYGLDYAALEPLNPRLVYCSITGFGQDGPYAARPGYDFMIQAMGGVMSVTGERDDLPGGGPQKVGVAVADITTGLYATIAIQAALLHRERSGRGQYIDMALLDCQVAFMANQAMNYLVTGQAPGRAGNAHPNIVPYQVFATRDGHIIVAVGNDEQYRRLCRLLGVPALAEDARFTTNAARVRHRDELVPLLAERLAREDSAHWLGALQAQSIPCGPINTLAQVFDDPQVRHLGIAQSVQDPVRGEVSLVGQPVDLSRTPAAIVSSVPDAGADTDEILKGLGLDDARIAELRRQGAL